VEDGGVLAMGRTAASYYKVQGRAATWGSDVAGPWRQGVATMLEAGRQRRGGDERRRRLCGLVKRMVAGKSLGHNMCASSVRKKNLTEEIEPVF
jgi:hypothetical protein